VVCEVSWAELYEGAPFFETLDDMLKRHGFRHADRVDELHDPHRPNSVLQSDELWLRN
jgi:hypothetical protein